MKIYPKLRYKTKDGSIVTINDQSHTLALNLYHALPATDQEAFNFVLYTLSRQGKRSVDTRTETCQYRSEDGSKCAVGHMIPDDKYHKGLEYIGVQTHSVRAALDPVFVDVNKFLLFYMQDAHDTADDGDEFGPSFRNKMRTVAKTFKLEYPNVENL